MFFFGHRSLIRNNTQTAVTNMTNNRMLETKLFNLTFRMFRHTSSKDDSIIITKPDKGNGVVIQPPQFPKRKQS